MTAKRRLISAYSSFIFAFSSQEIERFPIKSKRKGKLKGGDALHSSAKINFYTLREKCVKHGNL